MLMSSNDTKIKRMTTQGSYKIVKLLMNEEPTGNKSKMYDACESNPYFISDVHISMNSNRTEKILNNINKYVSPSDYLIILGDLTDKHTGTLQTTADFVRRIETPNKFLVIGNNDFYTIGDYIDMGFIYITDEFSFKINGQNYILSHCPLPIGNSKTINIHGHLHGSNTYWNMSPAGHYDVFIGTDAEPKVIRMNALLLPERMVKMVKLPISELSTHIIPG